MSRVIGGDELEFDFHSVARDPLIIQVSGIVTREVAKYLAEHSGELYRVPPDFFEKLVAEILASFGFEVDLNVRLLGSGAGDEADIVAFHRIQGVSSPIGYVVECKRYAEHRKVQLHVATRLFGLKELHAKQWGLDRAILATTSTVTPEVKREFGARWDFEIKEHEQIVEWLKFYAESPGSLYLYEQGKFQPASEFLITSLDIMPNSFRHQGTGKDQTRINSEVPRILQQGKEFHQQLQEEWIETAEGLVLPGKSIRKASGQEAIIDTFIEDDDTHVIVVEIKNSDWDRMTTEAVHRNVKRQARQVWDFINSQLQPGKGVSPGVILRKRPHDPDRQYLIEELFYEVGIVVKWNEWD